jgi:hypothetical protein
LQQGEARVLERQLTRRFGALPAGVQRRHAEADEPTLLTWSDPELHATVTGIAPLALDSG